MRFNRQKGARKESRLFIDHTTESILNCSFELRQVDAHYAHEAVCPHPRIIQHVSNRRQRDVFKSIHKHWIRLGGRRFYSISQHFLSCSKRVILIACNVQVKSTIQTTTMPYWNEILQVDLPSLLPSIVSICLETWIPHDPSSREVAEFEIFLTPNLEIGMGEAKLVAVKTKCAATSSPSAFAVGLRGGPPAPTLRVTCSLDRDLVTARQRGLWPLIKHRGSILKAAPMQRLDVPQEPEFPLLMHHSAPNDIYESNESRFRPSASSGDFLSNNLALCGKELLKF